LIEERVMRGLSLVGLGEVIFRQKIFLSIIGFDIAGRRFHHGDIAIRNWRYGKYYETW
jgi:hypothetical protein